jgi:hypothetical protein
MFNKSNENLTILPYKIKYSHLNLTGGTMLDLRKNWNLDFSDEANIFIDIGDRLNSSLNHIQKYSFQPLKSESFTIKFCLRK